jgi:hypothetical protein
MATALPTSEANGVIAAQAPPLRARQVVGLALLAFVVGLAAVVFALFPAETRPPSEQVREKLGVAAAFVAAVLLIGRTMVFLGWRKIDGFQFDPATATVRFSQRKLGGSTTRTVLVAELVEIREMIFSDLGGAPVACFDFRMRNGEKLRFHPHFQVVPFKEVKQRLSSTGLLRS